jgi:hypothetical protein
MKQQTTKLDYSQIDDVVVGNIDHSDYPDFSDASIESAMYNDPITGEYRELDEDELATLDSEWVYERVIDQVY